MAAWWLPRPVLALDGARVPVSLRPAAAVVPAVAASEPRPAPTSLPRPPDPVRPSPSGTDPPPSGPPAAEGTLVGVLVGVLTGFFVPLPIAAMALLA